MHEGIMGGEIQVVQNLRPRQISMKTRSGGSMGSLISPWVRRWNEPDMDPEEVSSQLKSSNHPQDGNLLGRQMLSVREHIQASERMLDDLIHNIAVIKLRLALAFCKRH